MKKYLKRIIIAVVLLVVIGLVIAFLYLNSIVKYTVETQATNSLNLSTQLSGASVSVFGGNIALNDLSIASPQGFQATHILTLQKTAVTVNYSELTNDPIRIVEVTINHPRLVIEQANGKFNINAMMEQMPKAPEQKDAKPSKLLKLVITKLQVNDAEVVLRPGLPGLSGEIVIPIPSMTLENVGTGSGGQEGAGMKEVIMQVTTAMADFTSKSDKLPAQLRDVLNVNVGQIAKDMSAAFDREFGKLGGQLKDLSGNVGGAMDDMGKNIDKGLKDLFGNDKKKE